MAEFPQIDSGLAVPVFWVSQKVHYTSVYTALTAYQADDLDANDSDCEEISNSQSVLKANLSRLTDQMISLNFGKRFVPQQKLSNEQAFQLQPSHPNTDQSVSSLVKIEAPRELPKVSMVNTSLKKLKYHLGQFDNVVKKEIASDALTEGEWGFEHTKAVFLKEIIPFVKTLKDIFNVFDKDLLKEVTEVQRVFTQMEAVVQQYHVDKQCFEIQKKHFLIENDKLLDQIISQDIVNCVVNYSLDNNTSANVNSFVAMNDSVNYVERCNKSELQAKDTTIKKLKAHIKRVNETSTSKSVKKDFDEIETINIELEHKVTRLIAENEHLKQTYKQLYDSIKPSRVRAKEQNESLVNQEIANNDAQMSNAATIAPGMYKLDPVILAHKVKNNREAHEYYLKHTMEQAAILREVVEQAKSQNPLDSASYYACMYVKLIQELLGYVRDTCHGIYKPSEKLVAVTPINKKKIVQFADTAASSSNMPKVTNRPLLSSIGVKPSTSASGSKPSDNTKNDRISRTPSSNKKNKVEVQSSMNVRDKSASKKNKKRKEWKPTGKVFNSVGYKWKPTGRTFTLVGNACPLTRITATNKVPLRVPIPLEVVAPEHVVTRVYTRRPKVPKSVPNSKTKVVQIVLWYLDSGCSKHMTGDRSQLTNFIHKFLGTIKFDNDQVAKIMGYGDYQIGNVTISRVYYVEGLGHNLFSVGQFYDSDLEVAFQKHTCFVRNLEGVDLLSGSQGTILYSLSIGDMMASSPICLLSKATKTKSWL
ncbi:hypothetical protein Tco_0771946 [Tanacetum coccineum]|uniref:Retrovirus-related Pol polyprotein from transposon TNT 1-94-like beta-barrel domain-containing protein n=1 Tax=Tanacetum coccineum TaxID=301880 RepID=A0ABQ4ZGU6_9ASTR